MTAQTQRAARSPHAASETAAARRDLCRKPADGRSVSGMSQADTSLRSAPRAATDRKAAPRWRASLPNQRETAPREPCAQRAREDARTAHLCGQRLSSKALRPAPRAVIRRLANGTSRWIGGAGTRIKTGRRGLADIACGIGAKITMRHGVAGEARWRLGGRSIGVVLFRRRRGVIRQCAAGNGHSQSEQKNERAPHVPCP